MHSALSLQGTGDVQNLCSESAEHILCSTTTVNCTIFDIYNDSTWVISSVNLILYAFVYCAYLQILGDDAYVLRIFDTSWRCWHMVQTIALPGSKLSASDLRKPSRKSMDSKLIVPFVWCHVGYTVIVLAKLGCQLRAILSEHGQVFGDHVTVQVVPPIEMFVAFLDPIN